MSWKDFIRLIERMKSIRGIPSPSSINWPSLCFFLRDKEARAVNGICNCASEKSTGCRHLLLSIIAIDPRPRGSTHGVKVSNDNNNSFVPEGIPRTVQFHNINFLLWILSKSVYTHLYAILRILPIAQYLRNVRAFRKDRSKDDTITIILITIVERKISKVWNIL